MIWNHIDIQFDGIRPSPFFKSHFQEKLSQVLEESPDDSVMRAQFREYQGLLEGTLEADQMSQGGIL